MQRLLPSLQSQALYRAEKSRTLEAEAQAGRPNHALMAQAGQAVARLALAATPHARRVWVACGPGNNGGDGLIAARWLHQQGLQVHVSRTSSADGHAPADASWALARALDAGVPITAGPPGFAPDLVIDALLGLGGSRAPEGAIAECIARINAMPAPVLAVDIPTGLDGDSGRLLGDQAVRAEHTLCLLSVKPGLLTGQGRAHAGTLWFDALGTTSSLPPDAWLLARDALLAQSTHAPGHDAHKGSQGDVLVVGGAAGMQGAARLAARSALAAGAGRGLRLPAGRSGRPRSPARRADAVAAGAPGQSAELARALSGGRLRRRFGNRRPAAKDPGRGNAPGAGRRRSERHRRRSCAAPAAGRSARRRPGQRADAAPAGGGSPAGTARPAMCRQTAWRLQTR